MRTTSLCLAIATLALSACTAANSGGVNTVVDEADGPCKAEPGQSFIGQKATADTGAELLKATGATKLRWVPPRTAVTMDFRPDRLTVSYDDQLVIERVSCG